MLDQIIIEELKKKVGKEITTTDCQWLAQSIADTTGEMIGETTLKRMLGFTGDKHITPRRSTLDIIAEYLGYSDNKDMSSELGLQGIVSDFAERETIQSDSLNLGDTLEIKYSPKRLIVMKYVGNSLFLLEEVNNSRNLQAGDIVKITHFAKGFLLYMSEVIRNGRNLGAYEAAKNGGVSSIEVLP